jgi:hypothetical protein
MSTQITNIELLVGNDLTQLYTMRYRLLSANEEDASYTTVKETLNLLSVIMPFFDTTTKQNNDYVVHTYLTAEGTGSGTKITITVDNELTQNN